MKRRQGNRDGADYRQAPTVRVVRETSEQPLVIRKL